MHLGGIVALAAQDVHYFAARCHLVVAPCYDTRYCLVAVLAALQLAAGYEYVGGQELGVGDEQRDVAVHLDGADEYLVLAFEYFHDACLGVLTAARGGDHYTHLVAVEGVHGVALGHQDVLVVDDDGVPAVAAAHEVTDVLCASVGFRLILAERYFEYLVGLGQSVEDVYHVEAVGRIGGADGEGYLLVVECFLIFFLEELHYAFLYFGLAHTFPALFRLFHCYGVIYG